jgi:ferritin-like metal-binding protein YciE
MRVAARTGIECSMSGDVPMFPDGFCLKQEQPLIPPVSADISKRADRHSGDEPAAPFCSGTRKDQAMGLFTKDIKTMNDLFVHQLQDIYYAEKQLVKALPKMADKATDKQLKQGFLTHLDETKIQVQRLEQVFQMHGAEVKAVNCPAIDGIIKEADEVAGEVEDKSVLDAALINAAQAVEHYEIARYGSLVAWAKLLGRNDCATVLQKTLDEEKATDKKLTTLAESKVNLRAAS